MIPKLISNYSERPSLQKLKNFINRLPRCRKIIAAVDCAEPIDGRIDAGLNLRRINRSNFVLNSGTCVWSKPRYLWGITQKVINHRRNILNNVREK
jgi:hypothetical protein